MTGFPSRFKSEKRAKAHTIKYGTRIKTIPKHVQLVPEKYRSIFVRNKIAGKTTAIDGEIRRLPFLIENTDIGTLFNVWFIHDSDLFRVWFIHDFGS